VPLAVLHAGSRIGAGAAIETGAKIGRNATVAPGAVVPPDGLLVLRYVFGFSGPALTAGAVDMQNCMRCDAEAIEPYLAPFV
jgi:carbonic anhydrase/acetyltransferase-like protein (isoleucine patch superfamily)